ncbi:MAG: hypothetical protein VKJ24_18175 [Synechococcales bacterium]|nr:hypothetical protein [Synechococcales bacterium]
MKLFHLSQRRFWSAVWATVIALIWLSSVSFLVPVAVATELLLPPAEEVPEEVLRTEIILEGRSPLDGKRLTAAEYAELQLEIAETNQVAPEVSSDLRNLIGLLKLRKFIKTFLPFFPIK